MRLTEDVEQLRYVVCAPEEVSGADDQTLAVTAADIFRA